jgi:hypothetical protein
MVIVQNTRIMLSPCALLQRTNTAQGSSLIRDRVCIANGPRASARCGP